MVSSSDTKGDDQDEFWLYITGNKKKESNEVNDSVENSNVEQTRKDDGKGEQKKLPNMAKKDRLDRIEKVFKKLDALDDDDHDSDNDDDDNSIFGEEDDNGEDNIKDVNIYKTPLQDFNQDSNNISDTVAPPNSDTIPDLKDLSVLEILLNPDAILKFFFGDSLRYVVLSVAAVTGTFGFYVMYTAIRFLFSITREAMAYS